MMSGQTPEVDPQTEDLIGRLIDQNGILVMLESDLANVIRLSEKNDERLRQVIEVMRRHQQITSPRFQLLEVSLLYFFIGLAVGIFIRWSLS